MPIFSTFLKCGLDFKHFEKKMPLIAYIFSKLGTAKDVVRQMSNRSCFRRPFDKQHVKRSQTLWRSARLHLYHIYWSLWKKFSWKKSIFVLCKILRLFVNTLTADDKYSFLNTYNLTQPMQIQLYKNQTFLSFLFYIWKI